MAVNRLLSYDAPSKLARIRHSRGENAEPHLRVSNEGLLRLRVARAQEIIRLHPYLFASAGGQFNSACLPQ